MDNYQAEGYVVLAMKDAGYNLEDIQNVKRSLWYMFDMKSEEEAEKQGRKLYDNLLYNEGKRMYK